jgi:hypothetical protein
MQPRNFGRPWVVFDANNRDHRFWFQEFLARSSWGQCPVRFVMNEECESASLVGLMQTQLLNYYTNREFGQTKVDKAA